MAIRKRLMHVAAGMADSFISRNNDLHGYWAPGLMYREIDKAPCSVVLDLLAAYAAPETACCAQIARNYAAFMRLALIRQNIDLEALTQATLEVAFNTVAGTRHIGNKLAGDPFLITVIFKARGRETTASRASYCRQFADGDFSRRAGYSDEPLLAGRL